MGVVACLPRRRAPTPRSRRSRSPRSEGLRRQDALTDGGRLSPPSVVFLWFSACLASVQEPSRDPVFRESCSRNELTYLRSYGVGVPVFRESCSRNERTYLRSYGVGVPTQDRCLLCWRTNEGGYTASMPAWLLDSARSPGSDRRISIRSPMN